VTMMFAAVLLLAGLGTGCGLALKGAQRLVVFWEGRAGG
jgi:ABC-type nitrate/sulfonate/bicarbonate transport system permease component